MHFKIDWASLIVWKVNLPVLLCLTLYLRVIFQVKTPGGLIFEGVIKWKVFCITSLGGSYLEGLIHGGAYFRNYMVDCGTVQICKNTKLQNFRFGQYKFENQ